MIEKIIVPGKRPMAGYRNGPNGRVYTFRVGDSEGRMRAKQAATREASNEAYRLSNPTPKTGGY